jgi:hypothetical protein
VLNLVTILFFDFSFDFSLFGYSLAIQLLVYFHDDQLVAARGPDPQRVHGE